MYCIHIVTQTGILAFLAPDNFGSLDPKGAKRFKTKKAAERYLAKTTLHPAVARATVERL